MTVVKSFPEAVVYAFAITSMNDVMRDYDTSSLFYDLSTSSFMPACERKLNQYQYYPWIKRATEYWSFSTDAV